jgi:hypothetical protein
MKRLRAASTLLAVGAITVGLVASGLSGCYSTGGGAPPPKDRLYFPTGLATSRGGNVLYAINSDFDLQFNGGTLQSFDLSAVRRAAAAQADKPPVGCPGDAVLRPGTTTRQPFGETCAPPADARPFIRGSVTTGAFATDLQRAIDRWVPQPDGSKTFEAGRRLFAPVRGDASLTWADIADDDGTTVPAADATPETFAPFRVDCGQGTSDHCDGTHRAGSDGSEPGNSRLITLPGEPFALAQSDDGTTLLVTHQTDGKVSLFSSGRLPGLPSTPSLQFVLDGVSPGGTGAAALPLSPVNSACASSLSNCNGAFGQQAFLMASRSVAELTLLRQYSDEGYATISSPRRPFLVKEATYAVRVNASGADSRAVLVDPTPRMLCEAKATTPQARKDCDQVPLRLFLANRSPSSLIVGEIGEGGLRADGSFDATAVRLFKAIPMAAGPSRLYLAPIVGPGGVPALRLFVVCYDGSAVVVVDPEALAIENILRVAPGPYAMAFDPYDLRDIVRKRLEAKPVPVDDRPTMGGLLRYRFAYVASFTRSFVQVVDLDNSRADRSAYQTVVFNLGIPVVPKGN